MNAIALSEELFPKLRRSMMNELSQRLGIGPAHLDNAVRTALPILFRALERNIMQPSGVAVLFGAIPSERLDTERLVRNIANRVTPDGDILEQFFDDQQQRVIEHLARNTDMTPLQARDILMTLAPTTLFFLAERAQRLDGPNLRPNPGPRKSTGGLSGNLGAIHFPQESGQLPVLSNLLPFDDSYNN